MNEGKSSAGSLMGVFRFFTFLPRVFSVMSVMSLIAIVGMLFLETVVRLFFRFSLFRAPEEVGGGLITLFVLFSVAWIYQERKHLNVTFIKGQIPYKQRRILELVLAIFSLIFVSFVTFNWLQMALFTMERGRLLRMTGIPVSIFEVGGVLGWAILVVAILGDIVSRIKGLFMASPS